jgi:hypothetical protein
MFEDSLPSFNSFKGNKGQLVTTLSCDSIFNHILVKRILHTCE